MATKTSKTPPYTPEMEARILESAPLNQAIAAELAKEFGPTYSARSVTAKAVRMGVPYDRKQPTTKSGDPVERKEAIVAQIAEHVQGNLDGLDKAPKAALQALRNALVG